MKSTLSVCLSLCFCVAASASQTTTIEFESIGPSELISDQYAELGITFGAGLFGDPAPGSSIQGSREATNFSDPHSITNPITVSFARTQTAIDFLAAGGGVGSLIEIQAYLGSDQAGSAEFETSAVAPGGSLSSVLAGIEVVEGFDRLLIRRADGNGAFSIDAFRFQPVPESASVLLLAVVVGAAAVRHGGRTGRRVRVSG